MGAGTSVSIIDNHFPSPLPGLCLAVGVVSIGQLKAKLCMKWAAGEVALVSSEASLPVHGIPSQVVTDLGLSRCSWFTIPQIADGSCNP